MKKAHSLPDHRSTYSQVLPRGTAAVTASGGIPEEGKGMVVPSQRAPHLAEAMTQGPPKTEELSWYSPGCFSPNHSLPLFHPENGKFTPPV